MESLFEYGSRAGLWRVLRAFERRKLPLTIFAAAVALKRHPEAAAAYRELGHEIAGHGLRWISYQLMDEPTERAHLAEAVAILQEVTGTPLLGWYTGRDSPNTRRLVVEHGGFVYDSDSYADDLPYWTEVTINSRDAAREVGGAGREAGDAGRGSGDAAGEAGDAGRGSGDAAGEAGDTARVVPHLVVPYTLDSNDMRFAALQGFNSGTQFFDYVRDAFDTLYREGDPGGLDAPKMLSIGLHARLIGRPGRVASLERFLDYILEHEHVWVCRRIDIAKHWISVYPASMPSTAPSPLQQSDRHP